MFSEVVALLWWRPRVFFGLGIQEAGVQQLNMSETVFEKDQKALAESVEFQKLEPEQPVEPELPVELVLPVELESAVFVDQVCVKCGRIRQINTTQRIIRCPYCRYEFNRRAEAVFLLEEEIFELETNEVSGFKTPQYLIFSLFLCLIIYFVRLSRLFFLLPLAILGFYLFKRYRLYFSPRLKNLRLRLAAFQKD